MVEQTLAGLAGFDRTMTFCSEILEAGERSIDVQIFLQLMREFFGSDIEPVKSKQVDPVVIFFSES